MIAGLALAAALQGPVHTTVRANLGFQQCIGLPRVPTEIPGGYLGKGGMFCVNINGPTGSRINFKVWLERRLGIPNHYRWIASPVWFSRGWGPNSHKGYYAIRQEPRPFPNGSEMQVQRLRTCVSANIEETTGIIIKKYGRTCSSAVDLH